MTRWLAVTSLLAVGCAGSGLTTSQGWSAMRSAHFTVYAGTPRDAKPVLVDLEYKYAALRSSFFNSGGPERVDVLFLSGDDFGSLVGFRRGSLALARVPSGKIGGHGLLVVHAGGGGDGAGEALAHLFIEQRFPHAPLWFHEGFSSYARTVEYAEGGGRRMACFGTPKGDPDSLLPLAKVDKLSWDDYDGDEARSWYKYTGRTLIDYILHGDDGKNRSKMGPLAAAMGEGKSIPETMTRLFPDEPLPSIDKKLSAHAADVAFHLKQESHVRGVCPLPFPIPDQLAAPSADPDLSPAAPEDIQALVAAVRKLPRLDGYPPWYPEEVVARVR